ncbi:MAG: helix-turn-helix domain-containing protein [Polyangiaceae bacterium]|nr:helix-turn-helix domain-containing protein [Polyangiaceae bacterium]
MRIRKLRMEQGVSLRDFGKQAGVHPLHVMAIELGQVATNTKTLRAIAKALGVEPLDLLNYDTENDDMGQIVELLRKHPDCVRTIMIKVRPLAETERVSWALATHARNKPQAPCRPRSFRDSGVSFTKHPKRV